MAVPISEVRGQDILELARRRHGSGDSTLTDYSARITTLLSIGFTDDPLAPARLIVANETASSLKWHHANALQIRMLGQRQKTAFLSIGSHKEADAASIEFGRPWFVASAPGDSLRILGGIGIPSRAAVHPFAPGAERFYTYRSVDTVTLILPSRRVQLVEVEVTPIRGDESLVVGSIWIDALTGDVAAMQVRFVGKRLWANDEKPEGSTAANRVRAVAATLRQQLWEDRYWLPLHQEVELLVRVPLFGDIAVPFIVRSHFDRFAVNTGKSIEWLSPDSLRDSQRAGANENALMTVSIGPGGSAAEADSAVPDSSNNGLGAEDVLFVRTGRTGGGWEIIRPPDDTLSAYAEWGKPLEIPASELNFSSASSIERRARQLPTDVLGRSSFALQYDRLAELVRYNRVEALGFGLAGRLDIPRLAFWSLGGALGFGIADAELKGRLDLRYDAPGTRADLAGYSELHVAGSELGSRRRAYGNAYRAFFLGRDDADYYQASGVALSLGKRWGWLAGRASAAWESQRSVDRNTDIAITGLWEDSVFPANPPALEDDFWRGELSLTGYLGDWSRPTNRAELQVGFEFGSDGDSLDYLQPRADLQARFDIDRKAALAVTARGGWTVGDSPIQRNWRLGGIESVRGFAHGAQTGESVWSAQIELSPGRRSTTPVVFADVGWAGSSDAWPGDDPLWSLGAGVSFFYGLFRAEVVTPKLDDVWLEFYFAGAL